MSSRVNFSDLVNENRVRTLSRSEDASELLDEEGQLTGIRVYGNTVTHLLERLTESCHLGGRYRNAGHWRPKSSEEIKALVDELGYLVIGVSDGSYYGRIAIFAEFDSVLSAWEAGLSNRRLEIMAFMEEAGSLARAADKRLDAPF